MRNKLLWCAVGLLAATCAGQGYYIHAQKEADRVVAPGPWAEQDKWIADAKRSLYKGNPVPFRQFDELFNDDFFGRKFDPFAEIEDFRKRLNPLLDGREKALFGHSWDGWFQDRMGVGEIHPETRTTDKEVILSFHIPGLDGESLNISVNDDRIRIVYDAKTIQDKKDGKGASYFKSESARHFEKIMPVPRDADARKNRIVREGNTVKVVFEKRRREGQKA